MSAEPQAESNLTTTVIPPRTVIALLAMQGALFVAAGAGLWIWSGRVLADLLSVSVGQIAVGVGFGAALIVTAAALFHGFPKMGEHLVRLQSDTYRFLGRDLGWPAIILISLVAGIGEEVSLRGGLQTVLGDHLGAPMAIVLASALFAALHLAKPLITALLFVIGLVFGAVYWYTGSLLAVIIGHVLYDIWALRYLHREMHRLGLFGDPAPLAKAGQPS